MNQKMKAKLEQLATCRCWFDEDGYYTSVDDYAGGNLDDAYEGGVFTGEVMLARELLEKFGDDN